MFEDLSEFDRKALVLAKAYEQSRQLNGQPRYQCFSRLDQITSNPVFKQFRTVTQWLIDKGWSPTWKDLHWQGYVKFAFTYLKPAIPQPGQLKNEVMLKHYLSELPDIMGDGRTPEELNEIYKRVLRPEVLTDPGCLISTGLHNIHLYLK